MDIDVFEYLEGQHQQVHDQFQMLRSLSDGDHDERKRLFKNLLMLTQRHARIEEEIVYPRLMQEDQLRDLIQEGIEEHKRFEQTGMSLDKWEDDLEAWEGRAEEMMAQITHHVTEEETEIFPKARELLGEQEMQRLMTQVQQFEEKMWGQDISQPAGSTP